jgi:hypothetical protein
MSATRERDEGREAATHPDLPDRADGSTELSFREALLVLFYDPAVRNYTIAVFSALAMIFLVLFQQASDLGGAMIVLLGVAGVLFRWVAVAPINLLILTYFMAFPFGIPGDGSSYKFEIENGRFRVPDLILVLSALVYVACHYRLIGLVHQGVAYDGAAKRRDETPTRRPAALIAPSELGILLGLAVLFTVVGQLIWWYATGVEINPTEDFPILWVGAGRTTRDREEFGVFPIRATIFFILLGLLFFGTLIARLVFRYWQLRMMSAAEAGTILLDGGWVETKRERSRLEKWRLWGRKRAEARAKAEAEAEEIEQAKERATKAQAERRREERERREQRKPRRPERRGTR